MFWNMTLIVKRLEDYITSMYLGTTKPMSITNYIQQSDTYL